MLLSNLNIVGYPSEFEEREMLYNEVRKKEGRNYSLAEVSSLPDININHPHHREWHVRKKSFERFRKYLDQQFSKPIRLLDLGCGNCWMSANLSLHTGRTVWGVDLNIAELRQGSEVFKLNERLQLAYADVFSGDFPYRDFDVIILAASAQYFPELKLLIHRLMQLLRTNGEIHFLDTKFYRKKELEGAKVRTKEYYIRLGIPEMSRHYFHHSLEELLSFNATRLYSPGLLEGLRYIMNGKRIEYQMHMPWYVIRK